jgi:hypothetical protein
VCLALGHDEPTTVIWGAGFVVFTSGPGGRPAGDRRYCRRGGVVGPARTEVFADLVEAAYDLYRCDVYRQLWWLLPATPAEYTYPAGRLPGT